MLEKPDLERIRGDRQLAHRAAEEALQVAQEAGRTRQDIERSLARSEQEAEQYRRVFRRAHLLR
jgi:hypothetical protein